MRWYSRARRALTLEDQFLYHWFVIEILAGAESASTKIVDKCPRCQQDLACINPSCGHPEHRPYESQRIGILLTNLGMPEALIRGVKEVRNLLSHGVDRQELVARMKKNAPDFELERAVSMVASFGQDALHRALDLPLQDPPLTFYVLENTEHLSATAHAHLSVETKGDPLDPTFNDVWLPELTMIVTDPITGEKQEFGSDGTPKTRQQ